MNTSFSIVSLPVSNDAEEDAKACNGLTYFKTSENTFTNFTLSPNPPIAEKIVDNMYKPNKRIITIGIHGPILLINVAKKMVTMVIRI